VRRHFTVPLQNVNALLGGDEVPLPFTFILDYLYGIVVYKAWCSKSNDGFNQLEEYRNEHYARRSAPPGGMDDTDVPSEPEDPNYSPSRSRKCYTPTGTSGLEETMDELNMFFMRIYGITPEMGSRARAERNRAWLLRLVLPSTLPSWRIRQPAVDLSDSFALILGTAQFFISIVEILLSGTMPSGRMFASGDRRGSQTFVTSYPILHP
jgi:hypothetical protein